MNKTAIKNFAVWAREKLIDDIKYRAGMTGIDENGIAEALPQSTKDLKFFDIGTKNYAEVSGDDIEKRNALINAIKNKERKVSGYEEAFNYIVEEVAYTWFNRLIAIRFMEVNGYLPSGIRVLSSENKSKKEPDMVTTPFDMDLEFTSDEQDRIIQLKDENKLDELFRMLFIKQCNKLNEILPELFEETNDFTESLLSISFTDEDGIVYKLVHDIDEDDFNIEKEGQIEIIGWLYQFYNIEPKAAVFAKPKGTKIKKEEIPAATQLFTPGWIVKYMVENSLGRLWIEGHKNDSLKSNWKYYLDEAEQEAEVEKQLQIIRDEYKNITPESIKLIDPCMGSGHILVYTFDILMQIYESNGYTQREAAKSILENNIYGIDIDKRAYQLSYFAIMMKARQYNRRILTQGIIPNIIVTENSGKISSSALDRLGDCKDIALRLLNDFRNVEEYGSLLSVSYSQNELDELTNKINNIDENKNISDLMFLLEVDELKRMILPLVKQAKILSQKYHIVVTNPPYMKADNMSNKMQKFIIKYKENAKYDLYSAFIYRCYELLSENGFMALITMHNFMFAPSFKEMRDEIKYWSWINMVHLGSRAFSEISGEVVQTASYVISKSNVKNNLFVVDVTDEKVPEKKELSFFTNKSNGYCFNLFNIEAIPCHAFGYALSEKVIRLYEEGNTLDKYGISKAGVVTGADDIFVKYWFEVNNNDITYDPEAKKIYKYVLFSKGGTFNKWYGNSQNILHLEDMWDDTKTNKSVRRGDLDFYYKRGIGWSQMGGGVKKSFSEIINSVCKTTTPMFYPFSQDKYNYILGYLNSKIPPIILKSLNPTLSILTSDIMNLPFLYEAQYKDEINALVEDCISVSRKIYSEYEENWQFKKHCLIKSYSRLEEAYRNWKNENKYLYDSKIEKENRINNIFENIMDLRDEIEEIKEISSYQEEKDCIVRLLHYAVGCMFGRYSLDIEGLAYAGGEWDDSKYSSFIPDADNCIPITDEEYFEDDIVSRFVEFVRVVYGNETLEENLDFIAKALGTKGKTSREIIRNYFLNGFIKDHIKTYQKRPIYWLFDSGKQNGFKALVYMHRWNADTIGNMRVEYLHRMQRVYEKEMERMQEVIDNSKDNKEINAATKRKEKLQKQYKETKDYDVKVGHLALSRIDIDLDDGVKVNYEKVQTANDGTKQQIFVNI